MIRLIIRTILTLLAAAFLSPQLSAQSYASAYDAFCSLRRPALFCGNISLSDLHQSIKDSEEVRHEKLAAGIPCIRRYTQELVEVQASKSMLLQYRLLPMMSNGQQIMAEVCTNNITPIQSVIRFWLLGRSEIEEVALQRMIEMPPLSHFLYDSNNATSVEVQNALVERGSLDYEITLSSAEQPTLTIRISTFDSEKARALHPALPKLLRPEGVTYIWSHDRFIRKI